VSLVQGQAFLFDLRNEPAHLWVIVSDPDADGNCLIVSLTSFKGCSDRTVVLNAGEHPFIKWPTCVAYAFSDLITEDQLANYVSLGHAKMHVFPLKEEIVKLVFDGFLASPFTKKRIKTYVRVSKEKSP
jgi:hypothetical protein